MDYRRLRVFISSRMEELAAERAAIRESLDTLQIAAWEYEHDAGSRETSVREAYLDELESADLYLGVFATVWYRCIAKLPSTAPSRARNSVSLVSRSPFGTIFS